MGLVWTALPLTWKIGIIVGAIALLFTAKAAYDWKIAHDAVVVERAKVETEKDNAIKRVNKAKDALDAACKRDARSCVPDDWFRDDDPK